MPDNGASVNPGSHGWEYHADRIVEVLKIADGVLRDHSMPPAARAVELRRLAARLDSHVNRLEAAAELEDAATAGKQR